MLSECVLVYMEPAHSSPVLAWAAATFPNALVAIYEQVGAGWGEHESSNASRRAGGGLAIGGGWHARRSHAVGGAHKTTGMHMSRLG